MHQLDQPPFPCTVKLPLAGRHVKRCHYLVNILRPFPLLIVPFYQFRGDGGQVAEQASGAIIGTGGEIQFSGRR